ncbi:MAG: hypothetical protein PHW22_03475 [Bacilli bacterium]|nr:hypothetical protein [Bacilli bacterium]
MKYQINTLIATIVNKNEAPKGSVGAIIGFKEDKEEVYLIELFNVNGHEHLQLYYDKNEIYAIQQ